MIFGRPYAYWALFLVAVFGLALLSAWTADSQWKWALIGAWSSGAVGWAYSLGENAERKREQLRRAGAESADAFWKGFAES